MSELADLPSGRLSIDHHCRPNAFTRSSIDTEAGVGIFPQRLNNQCSDFSRNWPRHALWQSCSVVGDDDAIVVLIPATFDRDDPAAATTEGIFKRVCEEFIYDKSHGQRGVNGNGSMVHSLIESNSVDRMGVHDGCCDLAEVVTEIDLVTGGLGGKGLIEEM
jgi:hypothetical protein